MSSSSSTKSKKKKRKPQKRRPEIMKPGLKQLTPFERQVIKETMAAINERWKKLFALNKCKS
jgi:hypothetical protein